MKFIIFLFIYLSMIFFFLTKVYCQSLGSVNIELKGNIINYSCTINSSDDNQVVDLGTWTSREFKIKGQTTHPVLFNLHLSNCPPNGNVAIIFSGKSVSQQADLLALNSNVSSAKNIAIEIRDQNRNRIPLGKTSPSIIADTQGNVKFNFYANYIAIADNVIAGSANSDATIQINYN